MKKKLKKGDLLELEIIDLTSEGLGVGKINGFAIFVEGGLPGDRGVVELRKIKKSYAIGKMVDIKEISPNRIESKCKYFKECGGCQLHELDYKTQLDIKTEQVKNTLNKIGKIEKSKVNPIIGMESPYRYRNKGQFKVGSNKEEISIGYFKRKSHEIVNVDKCIIQNEISDKIMKVIKTYMEKFKVPPYNKRNKKGIIRDIVIRTTKDNLAMVIIVTKGNDLPYKKELIKMLKENVEEVVSIYQNINNRNTPVVLGNKEIKLYGEDKIVDYIGDYKFLISPKSFLQVNSVQTEILYKKALEYLDLEGNETIFDLYCGIGTISLFISKKAKKVYGIEVVKDAVEDAKENAKLNNVNNVEFIKGKTEEIVPILLNKRIIADKVVVDPPRKGCDEEVLETIVKMKPETIVYVSCNPATLARDLRYLEDKGYKVEEVQPVDMFAHTMHVETCVLLSHKNADSHIHVNIEFGEGDGKIPVDKIAQKAEDYRPSERVTYKMIQEYIESKYDFKVHTAYIAEVKRSLGLPMYDAPNAVEELKHERKHPTPEKVEAIKDAFKYFKLIH